MIRTENGLLVRTHIRYNEEGQKTYESLPFLGDWDGPSDIGTTFQYDSLGRVSRATNAAATYRTYEYDGNMLTVRDEKSRATVFTRKAFGDPDDVRLTGLRDADEKQWTYTYDALDQLTVVTGPDGIERRGVYDSQFPTLLRTETHPESGTVNYTTYDSAGVLKSKTDAKGTVINYEHDDNDRVTKITTGSQVTTIAYESGSNNVVLTSVDGVSTAFTYDAAGRVRSRTELVDGRAFDVVFAYDANDNVQQITYPSGRRIGYEYDAENRVSRVFNAYTQDTYASNFDYHQSGGLREYRSSNGLITTIGFHPTRYWVSSIGVGDLQLGYQYDDVGNVSAILDNRAGMNQTVTYDAVDRVQTVTSTNYPSLTFAYDAYGNRSTVNGSPYAYFPGTFRLQSLNGLSMTYDANGNLESGPQATYAYRPNNWMQSSSVAGITANYAYSADDSRVKKEVVGGTTTYFVDGLPGELLTEWKNMTPNAEVRDHIYAGSKLIGVFTATQPAR